MLFRSGCHLGCAGSVLVNAAASSHFFLLNGEGAGKKTVSAIFLDEGIFTPPCFSTFTAPSSNSQKRYSTAASRYLVFLKSKKPSMYIRLMRPLPARLPGTLGR